MACLLLFQVLQKKISTGKKLAAGSYFDKCSTRPPQNTKTSQLNHTNYISMCFFFNYTKNYDKKSEVISLQSSLLFFKFYFHLDLHLPVIFYYVINYKYIVGV